MKRILPLISHRPIAIVLLGALLTALAPAPLNQWAWAWIGLAPLWWSSTQAQKPRSAAGYGLLWGMIYHGISLAWITGLHPLTWMGISFWNSVAIVAVIWLIITLWGAIGVAFWSWAMSKLAHTQIPIKLRILSGVTLWIAIETLRSYSILDWTNLAYTQSPGNLWILHLGQLSGNAIISAAIVAVNGCLAEYLQLRQSIKFTLKSFAPAIAIFILAHILGFLLNLHSLEAGLFNRGTPIGFVQGNIPTRIKLSPAGIQKAFKHYINGYETLSNQGVKLILFPEGSMPFEWELEPNNPLAQVIRDRKTPIALGSFGLRGDRMTQSLMMLDEQANITSQYDKIKVVPLGEALPFEEVLGQFIGRLSPIKSFLLAGRDDQTFTTNLGPAAIGICYESAFPEIFRQQIQRGGQFIITASNLDPYSTVLMAQHEAHDVMRAIENQRDLVRVTNTGYSGFIKASGVIDLRSNPNQYEWNRVWFQNRNEMTLYTQFGNWITPAFISLTLSLTLWHRRT